MLVVLFNSWILRSCDQLVELRREAGGQGADRGPGLIPGPLHHRRASSREACTAVVMAQAHSGPAVPPQSTGARDSTGQLPSRRGFSAQNTYSLPPPVLPVSSLEPGNIYTQNREWNFERQDLARTWNWTPDSRTSPELILGRETFGNYRSVTKWPYPGPLKPAPTLPPPTGHLLMAARGTARRSMSTRHSVPTPFSGGTGIRQQSPMAMTAHSQMSIAHPQPILKKQGIKGLLVKGVPSDRSDEHTLTKVGGRGVSQ